MLVVKFIEPYKTNECLFKPVTILRWSALDTLLEFITYDMQMKQARGFWLEWCKSWMILPIRPPPTIITPMYVRSFPASTTGKKEFKINMSNSNTGYLNTFEYLVWGLPILLQVLRYWDIFLAHSVECWILNLQAPVQIPLGVNCLILHFLSFLSQLYLWKIKPQTDTKSAEETY